MGKLKQDDLLRSWKEIAAYLGVDVRTCHRWEDDRGMPVRRAPDGEKKSPVFAYRQELDAWFKEAFQRSQPPAEARPKRRLKWGLAGGAGLVLAVAVFSALFLMPRRQPTDFRIEGSWFVALDQHRREMWRKNTKAEDLKSEAHYRRNFQVPHNGEPHILPLLVIDDINADGDKEVVFALVREQDQTGEGVIFCWDRTGEQLWRFDAGRTLVCAKKIFSPDYRIAGFYCHDIDGDGKLETAVEAIQAPDWPCQLAMLDSSGQLIGEFWNAGYLKDLKYGDINGDGREELVVCGVNNEYQGGCLMVFDTRKISGGSPQSGDFVCSGIGPGSMLYYVRTPYVDVSRANGEQVDGLRNVDLTSNKWIRATAGNGLIYEFDYGLKCFQVSCGNNFKVMHDRLKRSGLITSTLEGDSYTEAVLKGIAYWDGQAWTSEPTPVKR